MEKQDRKEECHRNGLEVSDGALRPWETEAYLARTPAYSLAA